MTEYCNWETRCVGMHISDSINPLIQKDKTNKTLLDVVVRQYSKLMWGKVEPRLVVKAIVIARDRMQNYVDNGGSMTKTVEVITNSNGNKTSMTVRALRNKIKQIVNEHAEEVAAFDSAEKVRIARMYAAPKQRMGY